MNKSLCLPQPCCACHSCLTALFLFKAKLLEAVIQIYSPNVCPPNLSCHQLDSAPDHQDAVIKDLHKVHPKVGTSAIFFPGFLKT